MSKISAPRLAALAAAGVSALALAFTAGNEGTKSTAYRDQGGVWTICTGHTGPEVRQGATASPEACQAYLRQDMQEAAVAVQHCVKVSLTDNQRAALQDFAFNVGAGNLCSSTLVKRLNAGDYTGAAGQFRVWTKTNGVYSAGLAARREREAALFLKDTP